MADEIDVGTANEAPDPVQQVKDNALTQMARSEDAGDYIAERQARDAEARGEEVNGEDRTSRIRQALEQARAGTDAARKANGIGEPQPDLDTAFQDAEQEWQQAEQSEQAYESEREQAKAEGRFTAVAEMLKTANPQAHQEITQSLGALDVMMQPEQLDVLRREMVKGDPRES